MMRNADQLIVAEKYKKRRRTRDLRRERTSVIHRAAGRITSANSLQEHHLSRGPTAEDLSRAIIRG